MLNDSKLHSSERTLSDAEQDRIEHLVDAGVYVGAAAMQAVVGAHEDWTVIRSRLSHPASGVSPSSIEPSAPRSRRRSKPGLDPTERETEDGFAPPSGEVLSRDTNKQINKTDQAFLDRQLAVAEWRAALRKSRGNEAEARIRITRMPHRPKANF